MILCEPNGKLKYPGSDSILGSRILVPDADARTDLHALPKWVNGPGAKNIIPYATLAPHSSPLIAMHGCQVTIARFLDRMCLALRAAGLWLRYATLQNLIPSFPWIAPPTPSTLAQSKERKGSNFAIWQPWHGRGGRGGALARQTRGGQAAASRCF